MENAKRYRLKIELDNRGWIVRDVPEGIDPYEYAESLQTYFRDLGFTMTDYIVYTARRVKR